MNAPPQYDQDNMGKSEFSKRLGGSRKEVLWLEFCPSEFMYWKLNLIICKLMMFECEAFGK
jgi:hypothetical protein